MTDPSTWPEERILTIPEDVRLPLFLRPDDVPPIPGFVREALGSDGTRELIRIWDLQMASHHLKGDSEPVQRHAARAFKLLMDDKSADVVAWAIRHAKG